MNNFQFTGYPQGDELCMQCGKEPTLNQQMDVYFLRLKKEEKKKRTENQKNKQKYYFAHS